MKGGGRNALHPIRRARAILPRQGQDRRALLARSPCRLSATWENERRCSSPTSAIDVGHEHPHIVRRLGRWLSPTSTKDQDRTVARTRLHRLAPGSLFSAAWPQLEACVLTTLLQLRSHPRQSVVRCRATKRVTLLRRHHADPAFSAVPAVLAPISDASCRDGVVGRRIARQSRRQSRRRDPPTSKSELSTTRNAFGR